MFVPLAIASTLITARGYQQAAKAAKMEGALTARNIQEQAKIRKIQALQEHNSIMQNLESFKNTNAAISGVLGRDMGSDRSLKAILKRADKNNMEAIQRANYQSLAEVSKLAQQREMTKLKASNLSKAYRLKAFGTLVAGAYQTSRIT
jgi:hypothetical protein